MKNFKDIQIDHQFIWNGNNKLLQAICIYFTNFAQTFICAGTSWMWHKYFGAVKNYNKVRKRGAKILNIVVIGARNKLQEIASKRSFMNRAGFFELPNSAQNISRFAYISIRINFKVKLTAGQCQLSFINENYRKHEASGPFICTCILISCFMVTLESSVR